MSINGDEAEGIAYCTATLVNEVKGKDIITTNYVRYDVWDFELTEEEMKQMTAQEKDDRFADY